MNANSFSRRDFLNVSLMGLASGAANTLATEPISEATRIEARIRSNTQIQRAREVVLDILQPSQRDLEHGLELHRKSLVFDSYGFAPRAALDGDKLKAAAEEGASESELADMREEMAKVRYVTDAIEQEEFKTAWKAAGVTCIFQNAGEEGQDPLRLLKRLAYFTYVTDMMPDFITKAVKPDDVVRTKQQGRHCLYFSGNGVPITQDWISTHDELRYVRIFFQLGIRMMHITYNRRNMLGDGCAEVANGGLSDFGRHAIAEMNRVGIIVDVAHCGWQTSLEAAKVSSKPIVASHTTCTALHKHIRSKPNEVIQAVADGGGLIGICCISRFLGGRGDISAMLDHIDYVVKNFGAEHVAIGTDVAYRSRHSAAERRKIPRRRSMRTRWAALWPPDPFVTTPKMRDSMAWTNWPMFTVGMVQRGYSDEDIQRILGGNVLRVVRGAIA